MTTNDKENFVTHEAPQERQTPHKRRVRYSGKYPKKFCEKYKELNPDKYGDQIKHVMAKGNTPAGMHIPIMVKEILEVLNIKPGEQGFDGTLGYGGHTRAMLEKLQGKGHLYSGDIDSIEEAKTEARLRKDGFGEDIWTPRLMNFCEIDKLAQEVGGFDFVLADLGVSSMQIYNPERGFTYKADGPLDLRLDSKSGISAADRLKEVDRDELAGMFIENSDEPYAEEIARQICNDLKRGIKIETTVALHQEISLAFTDESNSLLCSLYIVVFVIDCNIAEVKTMLSTYRLDFLFLAYKYRLNDTLFERFIDRIERVLVMSAAENDSLLYRVCLYQFSHLFEILKHNNPPAEIYVFGIVIHDIYQHIL